MSKIKAVIFDFDGTIADTIPDMSSAVLKTISKYGNFGNIDELVKKSVGNGARKLMERVYAALDIPMDNFEDELKQYQNIYAEFNCVDTVLYPNTLKTFEGLRNRGIQIAMCTMKPYGATFGALKTLKIENYFSNVFSGDDMKAPKPEPWCVIETAKRLGISADECIMIGDSMTDVGAGISSGAVSVALLGGYYDQDVMKSCDANYIIDDIGRVLEIVDEING